MKIGTSGMVLWGLYAAFAVFALSTNTHEATFQFSGPLSGVKAMVWLALFVFLGYSVFCSFQENFFRSVRTISALYWGRQVGADLYLGLFVGLLVIFLNEGLAVALLWLAPTLIYANLVILLYVAIHFDSLVTKLAGLQATIG